MTSRWQQYKEKNGITPLDILNPRTKPSSPEKASHRLSICQECPNLVKLTNQCRECGCFMNLKVKFEDSKCPIGKWE